MLAVSSAVVEGMDTDVRDHHGPIRASGMPVVRASTDHGAPGFMGPSVRTMEPAVIHLDVPATLHCGDKGCEHHLSAKLVFNAMGTWNPILPDGHGWQVAPNENGIFVTFCPLHHSKIVTPTTKIGDLVAARNAKH